jgi:hypothetical protein
MNREKNAFTLLNPVIKRFTNKGLFYLKNYLSHPEGFETGTFFIEYKKGTGVTVYVMSKKNTGSVLNPIATIPYLKFKNTVKFASSLIQSMINVKENTEDNG